MTLDLGGSPMTCMWRMEDLPYVNSGQCFFLFYLSCCLFSPLPTIPMAHDICSALYKKYAYIFPTLTKAVARSRIQHWWRRRTIVTSVGTTYSRIWHSAKDAVCSNCRKMGFFERASPLLPTERTTSGIVCVFSNSRDIRSRLSVWCTNRRAVTNIGSPEVIPLSLLCRVTAWRLWNSPMPYLRLLPV